MLTTQREQKLYRLNWRIWQSEIKRGATPRCTLDPDSASMKFNDALHQRQPNACSFNFRIQAIEEPEDPFMEFRGNADAIIADGPL